MALDDAFNIVRPGQKNATGAVNAQHIEEFTGMVEGTIARLSAIAPLVPVRPVRGTSVLTNFAVGQSTLQKITPGQPIDGTQTKFGKAQLTIDTTLIARAVLPLLETFQTQYDARKEIASEHGKTIAKQHDEAFIIQAVKAGLLSANKFGITAAGHTGGSQVTFTGASDYLDPALLYAKLKNLITQMRLKDVDPVGDGVVLVVDPVVNEILSMSELLVNSEYKTSEGTAIPGLHLKHEGIKVISTNNFVGGKNITGNLLSNTDNGNAYDGDFTKVVACAFAPKALMAGETIALESDVFWDKISKNWFVDSWRAYGVSPSVAAFAGVLLNP